MSDMVCRAITFINYNIPIKNDSNIWDGFAEYYTTGFFDRMYTKRVDCDYASKQLRGLWDYNIDCIAKGDGTYAHQNVYCFSKDEWNDGITDEEFWDYEKYETMLLTFVIFVQTNEYIREEGGLERRCKKFNDVVCGQLRDDGYVYTYVTVDKNDFVICIRSKDYKKAVNAIMKLHETDCAVVYSYSIFGISKNRQERISQEEYKELNVQRIDSISLKGVTNSTKVPDEVSYTLDEKYVGFCKQLVEKLYEDIMDKKEPDYKIYDILGDNDFRLIARMVPLGNLIKQLGAGGLLDYKGHIAQYTFYSTHLVLNTMDKKRQKKLYPLEDNVICRQNRRMQEECYRVERCQKMKGEMERLNQRLREKKGKNPSDEKLVTAFHGIYQLLQSLTALEAAPTKKYDFLSLYYPMKTLIGIFNKKVDEETEELAENDNLYDFIHKISMVLHGTLRTDIQFFQIRDFNTTVHYAPAKLRAYYSIFVFMLSAHFSEVSSEENTHSYIFSPGMFRAIFVKQLFEQPNENERLMLITVPERYLYFPKNLSIILAHEVGHLIGDAIRKRKNRHIAILKCSYRVLCLEITKYVEPVLLKKMGLVANHVFAEALAFKNEDFLKVILDYDTKEASIAGDQSHNYYSQKSLERIQKVYRAAEIDFGYRIWNEYCCSLKTVYQNHINLMKKERQNLAQEARDNFLFYDRLVGELTEFFRIFEVYMLPDVLKMFHYLMSETVSDMLAILVLGLTPMEYISSLADEVKATDAKREFDNGVAKVRIDLVVSAIQSLQEEFLEDEQWYKQLEQWKEVYKNLIPQCEKNSGVFIMAMEAFCVERKRSNKMEDIENYESPFNRRERVFKQRIYDFLNDEVVYKYMCGYLVECGKEYIKRLQKETNCRYSRNIIFDTFRKCTNESPMKLISQVDIFLANFEAHWKDKYFK